jgi:hypothetical protein
MEQHKTYDWPYCPNCDTGHVVRLWTAGRWEKLNSAMMTRLRFSASEHVEGTGVLDAPNSPTGSEMLVDCGFRCLDCGKHWFQIPGDRIAAVDGILDFAKYLQRVPDKPSLHACNQLHVNHEQALAARDQADKDDEISLLDKLWVLDVDLHNEDPLYRVFTDEYAAWQYLATKVVSEMVDENGYPEVQALLDAGTASANTEAAKLFFNTCDGSKYSFTLDIVEGPLHPDNRPPDFAPCGCKKGGWDVFNEGEPGTPLGDIEACGECGHNNDEIANAHAVLAGYRTIEWANRFIVIQRPEDDEPVVAQCLFCDEPHLISEMVKVEQPTADRPSLYCPACFGGVKAAVNAK